MSEPFLGEVRMTSVNFAPKGWALCDGQLLLINQHQALFALLGTTYGGDGRTTFALPDLRGRMPVGGGTGPEVQLGQRGGAEQVTLTQSHLPPHSHSARAASGPATTADAAGGRWAATDQPHYGPSPQVAMADGLVGQDGGSQPHPNVPPYLTVIFMIAIQGIFPSQS
ncbi:phage tail protein [Actinotalea sp. BY-33]|uniref:Phage tail protein n=1 Tax=Actinotalea soli TaxID=2819234 RepID=A0A939LS42_9CELL|nr:tail fiber protein [Actinotalea soli]MBO1752045.1 phage tail protein [Actinotalea soli]